MHLWNFSCAAHNGWLPKLAFLDAFYLVVDGFSTSCFAIMLAKYIVNTYSVEITTTDNLSD